MIPHARIAACLSAVVALTAPAFAQDSSIATPVAMCSPAQITLTTDAGNGRFDGMNHSGTVLVLRNHSANACRLLAFARLRLAGKSGALLGVAIVLKTPYSAPIVSGRRVPVGLGHGPVALPIAVAPGAAVSAELTWVSGAVYGNSVCVDVASVSAAAGEGTVSAPLAAHICGPDAAHVSASLTRLVPYPRAPVSGI
jgi:Protein of unknown function (DUF4232)